MDAMRGASPPPSEWIRLPGVNLRGIPVLTGAMARRAGLGGTGRAGEGDAVEIRVRRGVPVVEAGAARLPEDVPAWHLAQFWRSPGKVTSLKPMAVPPKPKMLKSCVSSLPLWMR